MRQMNIKTIKAIYTGGGIWLFCGQVDDKFFMMDDYGCVEIFDADPLEDFDASGDPKWQKKHLVRELMSVELVKFQDKAIKKLLSTDFKERGYITDEEIDHYRTYFKELFD
jgi:hypothetical protein